MSETETERARIVKFLWDVYEASTHGASDLMERAIHAVERDQMSDPVAVGLGLTQDAATASALSQQDTVESSAA